MNAHAFAAVVGPRRVHAEGDRLRVEIEGREEALRVAETCVSRRIRWCAGNAFGQQLSLDLRPSAGIMDLWRDDLVLRVAAGTTPEQADRELRPLGLRLALDLPMPHLFTLGASFARGENGLSGRASGGLRERCLGLLAVDGRGRLLKAGARVVKNVAGYDLARLHHGAHGAFGVILDFVLRVDSLAEGRELRGFACALGDIVEELEARRPPRAQVEPIQQLWLDPAASAEAGGAAEGMLVLAHEGWESSLRQWVRTHGGEALDPTLARDWGYANDDSGKGCFRIGCAPRVWLREWSRWRRELDHSGCRPRLLVDLLGGRHRLLLDNAQGAGWFFEELSAAGAHWVGASVDPAAQEISVRLKQQFDPHGLLPALPQR